MLICKPRGITEKKVATVVLSGKLPPEARDSVIQPMRRTAGSLSLNPLGMLANFDAFANIEAVHV